MKVLKMNPKTLRQQKCCIYSLFVSTKVITNSEDGLPLSFLSIDYKVGMAFWPHNNIPKSQIIRGSWHGILAPSSTPIFYSF